MPKLKTRKSWVKRFKITSSGKVLRGHQYASHRRAHKTKRRIRAFHVPKKLTTRQAKIVKSLLNL